MATSEDKFYGLERLVVAIARKSFGTMFYIDFGDLSEWTYRHKGATRTRLRGEWRLIVELATWSYSDTKSHIIASSISDTHAVAIKALEGRTSSKVSYSDDGKLEILFSDGSRLSIEPEETDIDLTQWMIFRGKKLYAYYDLADGLHFRDPAAPAV